MEVVAEVEVEEARLEVEVGTWKLRSRREVGSIVVPVGYRQIEVPTVAM